MEKEKQLSALRDWASHYNGCINAEHNCGICADYAAKAMLEAMAMPQSESAKHIGWIACHCSDPQNCAACLREWIREALDSDCDWEEREGKIRAALAAAVPKPAPAIELAVRKLEEASIAIHDLRHESRGGFQWVKIYDALKIIADSQREMLASQPLKEGIREAPAPACEAPSDEENVEFNAKWHLASSNRLVDGIDPDNLSKKFSFELPGETRVTGNVGAWYHSAVYWKHRWLRALAASLPPTEKK